MSPVTWITALGRGVLRSLTGLGGFARLFADILLGSGTVVRRPRLVTRQIRFLGNARSRVFLSALCWVCRAITRSAALVRLICWGPWWRYRSFVNWVRW